MLYSNIILGFT